MCACRLVLEQRTRNYMTQCVFLSRLRAAQSSFSACAPSKRAMQPCDMHHACYIAAMHQLWLCPLQSWGLSLRE
jgi:hypothetical protein